MHRCKKPLPMPYNFNKFYENLILAPSHGLGVFAGKAFEPNEIVEVAPCIHDRKGLGFGDYVFQSSVPDNATTLVLGYGSLYNHDDNPNVGYYTHGKRFFVYYANFHIPAGQELTISYGPHWWDGRTKPPGSHRTTRNTLAEALASLFKAKANRPKPQRYSGAWG